MRITLPPGCLGLTDRTTNRVHADKARADRTRQPRIGSPSRRRTRSVDLTESVDLAAVKANPYLNLPAMYFNGDGWTCRCHFGNWAWVADCARCGATRPEGVSA